MKTQSTQSPVTRLQTGSSLPVPTIKQ